MYEDVVERYLTFVNDMLLIVRENKNRKNGLDLVITNPNIDKELVVNLISNNETEENDDG